MPKQIPQVGGMPQQLTDVWSKYSPPLQTFLLLALLLGTVFVKELPHAFLEFSDTVLGRAVHLALVYFITNSFGWVLGLVFALFVGVVIGLGSARRIEVKEGFNSDLKMVEQGHKWFVEKVLGENPLLIEEENVRTYPVQDLSRKGTGSYGGNVENTSVSM
jgi:hypothetical protein